MMVSAAMVSALLWTAAPHANHSPTVVISAGCDCERPPETAPLTPEIRQTLDATWTILASDAFHADPDTVIAAAMAFNDESQDPTRFTASLADQFITDLEAIVADTAVSAVTRSRAQLALAGVHGNYANSLGVRGGASHGKKAFWALKASLELNPDYPEAAEYFAETIKGMSEQNRFVRFGAERFIGIKLKDEAKQAIEILDRLKLTKNPAYEPLKAFIR